MRTGKEGELSVELEVTKRRRWTRHPEHGARSAGDGGGGRARVQTSSWRSGAATYWDQLRVKRFYVRKLPPKRIPSARQFGLEADSSQQAKSGGDMSSSGFAARAQSAAAHNTASSGGGQGQSSGGTKSGGGGGGAGTGAGGGGRGGQ